MAKIVFCEDDTAVQKLIRVALRASPHEILLAHDGVEGLELIRRERPDLIFTDISMPRMNGLELCHAVRADHELRGIPIVVITASVQRAQAEASFRNGATDFLAKPFTMDELRGKIQEHVG